eukprot:51772-Eustigmatos_ZCMA.PRE.1
MRAMYKRARERMTERLSGFRPDPPVGRYARPIASCITLDGWSSRANRHYVAILLRTLDYNFNMETKCLNVIEFKSKNHTADQITALIDQALADAEMPKSGVFRAVHDAANNMIAGVRGSDLDSILCIAHQIQRCIVGSLSKVPDMSESLKRVKAFVTHVHKSNVASADLKEKQTALGMFEHKLIQSNATRWNSTHDMADRLVEQRPALDAMYAADDHRAPNKQLYELPKRITPADYTILTDMSISLRAFREVSVAMQSDGVTSSLVIPMLYKLRRLLRTDANLARVIPPSKPGVQPSSVTVKETHMPQPVQALRRFMRDDFASRFSWSKLSRDWLIASAVDPRTKVLSAYHLTKTE